MDGAARRAPSWRRTAAGGAAHRICQSHATHSSLRLTFRIIPAEYSRKSNFPIHHSLNFCNVNNVLTKSLKMQVLQRSGRSVDMLTNIRKSLRPLVQDSIQRISARFSLPDRNERALDIHVNWERSEGAPSIPCYC